MIVTCNSEEDERKITHINEIIAKEPRITFIDRHYPDDKSYDNYVNNVLTDQERDWKINGFGPHNKKIEYTITYLSNVNEFIAAIEEYETNQVKKWVKFAIRRKNLEELKHHRKNPRFKEEWLKEFKIEDVPG